VRKKAKRAPAQKPAGKAAPSVVGKVEMAALDLVRPNTWNPNRLTPFEKRALKHGLEHDTWLPSHALTIWRTDEKGKKKMLVIDGEHRWTAARELGLKEGPMVFLDGLTEAEAKAWTVKLDAKRGKFDEDKMGPLLRSLEPTMDVETRALDLGIDEDRLVRYLDDEPDKAVVGELPSGQRASVRQVQLFFPQARYDEFQKMVREMAGSLKTKNVTDTVLEVVRRAGAAAAPK
jgi:hypothetical protein